MQKNPAQRYGPAEAIAEDLDRWLRHEPSRARPSQIWEHALKWTQRHPARAGLLAVALPAPAVIIAVLLVLGAKLAGERDRTREYLYAADMQVAQTALAEGNLSRAQRRTSRAARPCAPNSQSRFFAGWPLARLAGGGAGRPVLGYHHLAE